MWTGFVRRQIRLETLDCQGFRVERVTGMADPVTNTDTLRAVRFAEFDLCPADRRKRRVAARSGCAGRLEWFVAGDKSVPLVLGEVAADDLASSFDPRCRVERNIEHAAR